MKNYTTNLRGRVPAGVWVEGACRGITVQGCKISNIANTAIGGNAFGIIVYGTSAVRAAGGISIVGNEIFNLRTGLSESVVLNGNVDGFEVRNNRIHDNNNIGIDFIGYEGTCPNPALDRARNGVCSGNIIRNISTGSNPSYRGDLSAGGIYCDGSDNILIEGNIVTACDIGIELASEARGGLTSRIKVRDNFIHRCGITGISLGGYRGGLGTTTRCSISNNTLYANDTRRSGTGEISLQHNVERNLIEQNIVCASGQGLLLGSQVPVGEGNILRLNLYFTPLGRSGATWEWAGKTYDGLAAWRAAGRDGQVLFADPRFVEPASGDLHLKAVSPAIDAGSPSWRPAPGETDIDGHFAFGSSLSPHRLVGAAVDLGADELLRR